MTVIEQLFRMRHTLHRHISGLISRASRRPLLQLRVLRAIAVHGARTQVAVAETLLVDTAAVSRLVDRLVEDGLLLRQPGENRRCVHLEVTPAGMVEVEALTRSLVTLNRRAQEILSAEEFRSLSRLLDKLQTGLDDAEQKTG